MTIGEHKCVRLLYIKVISIMITILDNVLNKDELSIIHETLGRGQFYSGTETAGWAAKSVKKNQQWSAEAALEEELSNLLTTKLVTHSQFATTTYAKKIAPFIFSKSCNSGGYISRKLLSNSPSSFIANKSSMNLNVLPNLRARCRLSFFKFRIHLLSKLYRKRLAMNGAGSDPIGIPTICRKSFSPKVK